MPKTTKYPYQATPSEVKTCSRCHQKKPVTQFHLDCRYEQGVTGWCRECRREYAKQHKLYIAQSPKPSVTSKKCSVCKEEKGSSEFPKVCSNKDGLASRCKECRRKTESSANLSSEELSRRRVENRLQSFYGMSIEEFAEMLDGQGGMCAVCGKSINGRPNVDHCHATGKARGIVCYACNTGLSHIERPGFMEKAMAYLKRSGEEQIA